MKKPKNQPLSFDELSALAQSATAHDAFGPSSQNNVLVFDLSGSEDHLSSWLKDLPCPVIGLGDGALTGACDVVLPTHKKLKSIRAAIDHAPLAAMVLVQHLRASETLTLEDALTAESFAYATLQNGPEFLRWKEDYQQGDPLPEFQRPSVSIEIENGMLSLTMDRPETRNAIGVEMRDALCEMLDLAMIDRDISKVSLMGNGTSFSVGGAIEEFGDVSDPATAHWVRSLRLPAWRLARLGDKLHVHINGAAIGAGAEMAAFGSHVTASPKAWFQLPELKYGLIPGAGGTASIARRIGRQKTAYMALSMARICAQTALEWGLIDAIID